MTRLTDIMRNIARAEDHIRRWEGEIATCRAKRKSLEYTEMKTRQAFEKADQREWAADRLQEIDEQRAVLDGRIERAEKAMGAEFAKRDEWRAKYAAEKANGVAIKEPRILAGYRLRN